MRRRVPTSPRAWRESLQTAARARVIWRLSLRIPKQFELPLAALLETVCGTPPAVFVPTAARHCVLSVFMSRRSAWSSAQRRQWRAGVRALRRTGSVAGPVHLRWERLPRRRWAESWRRACRPFCVGAALWITPRAPSAGARSSDGSMPAVAIDPGLAFGTGHHATTRYCLSQLARLHRREPRQRQPPPHRPMSALDAGTGSGLLAIAAAKLGYRPVIAFDSDPDAVRVARGNIASNRVRGLVTLATGDLADRRLRIGGPFDVVCANLSAELLEAQSRRLSRWVNPGGHLVVAGILATEFAAVTRAFEGAGLRLQSARTEQGWRSGRFAKLEAGRTRRRHSPTRSSEKKLNAPGRHAL